MSNDNDTALRDVIDQRDLLQRAVDLMGAEVDRLEDQVRRDAETIRDLGSQIDQLQRRCQSWEERALKAEALLDAAYPLVEARLETIKAALAMRHTSKDEAIALVQEQTRLTALLEKPHDRA